MSEAVGKRLGAAASRVAFVALALLAHSAPATSGDKNLVTSGRLVCLGSDLKETSCQDAPARLALKADTGQLFTLAAGDAANTLLQEKRLQTRQFRLTLRSLDGGKTFQIVKTQLIRAGKVYDFHYFCEICNITTYTPGPCMCCRAPTEYREAPAET
ncbi:MAG: hypothetical protein OXI69_00635 [Acidobacteriota bacterium]|nr:hypothetical protein [Acidobacteriota bacterium]